MDSNLYEMTCGCCKYNTSGECPCNCPENKSKKHISGNED